MRRLPNLFPGAHTDGIIICYPSFDELCFWEFIFTCLRPRPPAVAEHTYMHNDIALQAPVIVGGKEILELHGRIRPDWLFAARTQRVEPKY